MRSAIGNLAIVDTTPGSRCWAAPHQAVDDYKAWLRERYRERKTEAQALIVTARLVSLHGLQPQISGPYADDLRDAIGAMAQRVKPAE